MNTLRRPTRFYEMLSQPAPAAERIAETASPDDGAVHISEHLVQYIWHQQLLKTDVLVTPEGRPVRVYDPGQWNRAAGPDFRNADIAIGGQRFRGDVEIHVHSSDWSKHGHASDFEYNNVVLHVVLHRDDPRTRDELQNGTVLPRLVLEDFVHPDLETIALAVASGEDIGLLSDTNTDADGESGAPGCAHFVQQVPPAHLEALLAEAGRERLESRVERYAHLADAASLDQALYQALLTGMGHKGSKTLFFLLARRAPLDDLQVILRRVEAPELPFTLEALLLYVSGLLPGPALEEPDSDTVRYSERAARVWEQYGRYFEDRVIPPTRRWMSGMRPANFPMRRIAGVARLLSMSGIRTSLLSWLADILRFSMQRAPSTARDFRKEYALLIEPLVSSDLSYWSHHYTLGGRPTARPTALIGDDRAMSILFNALLPVGLLHSRHVGDDKLEAHIVRLHDNFPALPPNTVTRTMRDRLFGAAPLPPGITFRLELQNQALLHIFSHCCSNGDLTCEQCVFRRVVVGANR